MKQVSQILKALLTLTPIFILLSFVAVNCLAAGNVENGKKIYDRHCMECHHTDGMGILAPPFVESTRFNSMDGVAALIDYIMPAESPDLCTGTQADDVAAYVALEFKFKVPKEQLDPDSVVDDAGRKTLFDQNCAVCHGIDGKGDLAKSITRSTLFKSKEDAVKFINGLMPFHNPKKCQENCADQAAQYIIDNFELKVAK